MKEEFTEEDCEFCYNVGKKYCNHNHSANCCCSECTADGACICGTPVRSKHHSDFCKVCDLLLYDGDEIFEECEQCCKVVESINDEGKCEECETHISMEDIRQIAMRNQND